MRTVERNVQQQQVFKHEPQLSKPLTPKALKKMTDPTAFKSKGKSFMQSLKKVGEITEQFSAVNQIYEKENVEQAILDYSRGKDAQLPKEGLNMGKGYMKQYSMMQGEDAGRIFRQRYINEIKYNNGFVNTENPEKEMKKLWDNLYREHIGGLADNNLSMFGAAEQINQAASEGTLVAAHSASEIFREDLLTTYAKNMSGSIADTVSIGGDSDMVMKTIENQFKAYGKEYPITRDNATVLAIDGVYKQIQSFLAPDEQGNIEEENINKALDMLEVFETPTSNGVAWIDMKDSQGNWKFRKSINNIQEEVLRQVRELENNKLALADETSEKFVDSVVYATATGELDIATAREKVRQGQEEGIISKDVAISTLKTVTKTGEKEEYVTREPSMELEFASFSARVANGVVSKEEAYNILNTMADNKAISRSEAITISKQIANRDKLIRNNPKYSEKFSILKRQLDPEDTILNMGDFNFEQKFDKAEAERIAAVYRTYWDNALEGSSPSVAYSEALEVNETWIKEESETPPSLSSITTDEGFEALEIERSGTDSFGKAKYKDKYGRNLTYEDVADILLTIEGEL